VGDAIYNALLSVVPVYEADSAQANRVAIILISAPPYPSHLDVASGLIPSAVVCCGLLWSDLI
jgi:hypothetical protein